VLLLGQFGGKKQERNTFKGLKCVAGRETEKFTSTERLMSEKVVISHRVKEDRKILHAG